MTSAIDESELTMMNIFVLRRENIVVMSRKYVKNEKKILKLVQDTKYYYFYLHIFKFLDIICRSRTSCR